ncbi:MAG: rod shape-determining protein MreC [Lentisphaerae bacterium GWF2_57_35]|nr:MAG: rod shape-determining protein MreC [Lentisphaerae bacterium GWF2_57_35]
MVWIALGVVLLAVLNLPEAVSLQVKAALRDGVAPLQGALASSVRNTKEIFRLIRGFGGLAVENEQLAAEVVRLRNEVRDLKALDRENGALRDQLKFYKKTSLQMIPCEVIARDITGWWQTIRLGKGSTDGILPNMAVISSDGLVGKTVAVSSRTADVLLISDPTCRVSAQIIRTGAFGIVSGSGPTERGQVTCRMEFINKTVSIQPGDEVITSGLGGVFPKGLLVGYADKVVMDESGLYQRADVIPRADLGLLEYVFAVVEQGDAQDLYLRKKQLVKEVKP